MSESPPPTLTAMSPTPNSEEDDSASNQTAHTSEAAVLPSASSLPSTIDAPIFDTPWGPLAGIPGRTPQSVLRWRACNPKYKIYSVKKGDVIWILFRKGPLWPALVANKYPKKFTYYFFPLKEPVHKNHIFSAGLKKEAYAFLARDDEPEATCADELLKEAFKAALEYCKRNNIEKGADMPERPAGFNTNKIKGKSTKKGKSSIKITSNSQGASFASSSASHDLESKEQSVSRRTSNELAERRGLNESNEGEKADKMLSDMHYEGEESAPPDQSEIASQAKCETKEEEDQKSDSMPDLEPEPNSLEWRRAKEDAIIRNFAFQRNHKLEFEEAMHTSTRKLKELNKLEKRVAKEKKFPIDNMSPTVSSKRALNFAIKSFEMVRPIAERMWQSESVKNYQPPDRDFMEMNVYTAGYMDDCHVDDLFNILVKFVLSKDSKKFNLLTATHLVCTILLPEVLINVLMKIRHISRIRAFRTFFRIGVKKRQAFANKNKKEKEPEPSEKPKFDLEELFRIASQEREVLGATTEPIQLDSKEEKVEKEEEEEEMNDEEEADCYRQRGARIKNDDSDEDSDEEQEEEEADDEEEEVESDAELEQLSGSSDSENFEEDSDDDDEVEIIHVPPVPENYVPWKPGPVEKGFTVNGVDEDDLMEEELEELEEHTVQVMNRYAIQIPAEENNNLMDEEENIDGDGELEEVQQDEDVDEIQENNHGFGNGH